MDVLHTYSRVVTVTKGRNGKPIDQTPRIQSLQKEIQGLYKRIEKSEPPVVQMQKSELTVVQMQEYNQKKSEIDILIANRFKKV